MKNRNIELTVEKRKKIKKRKIKRRTKKAATVKMTKRIAARARRKQSPSFLIIQSQLLRPRR